MDTYLEEKGEAELRLTQALAGHEGNALALLWKWLAAVAGRVRLCDLERERGECAFLMYVRTLYLERFPERARAPRPSSATLAIVAKYASKRDC